MSRVCLLVYDITLTGGAERVAINLANELSSEHNITIITLVLSGDIPKEIDSNVSVEHVFTNHKSITVHFLRYTRAIRNILTARNTDVLLAITAGVVTLALSSTFRINTKVLYCEHSNLENQTYGRKHQFRQYIGARCCDRIVALTERDRQNFINRFHVKPEKVCAIPNWYVPFANTKGYNRFSKGIISVGRLERVKGYSYLLECAKIILPQNPEWYWDIYGDGTLREELQARIDKESIHGLTLKGNVKDMQQRYINYSFLVMTSLYEGLPLTLLEAQASKLPIVSFDCPTGPSEIVSDGVNGYIVPQQDVQALCKAVQELIDSENTRQEFSMHAQDNLYHYNKEYVLQMWNETIQTVSE